MAQTPKVTTKPGEPMPASEIMAQAIVDIAAAMKHLAASPLKRSTIILLIHDATKLPRRQIEQVLNALESLETAYLKPRSPPAPKGK
jgi:hypothetical protein